MKNYLKLFFLLFFVNTINGQRIDVKFLFEGRLRESIIQIPRKGPPPGGYPVVMVLHSSAHNGEEAYNIFGWKELGESENFITLYPSSLKWCVTEDNVEKVIARWVNGNVTDLPCSGPPQNYVDDVKFLKELIRRVKDNYTVNSSKIYITGFSNGSVMVHKMAMDAGDIFSAASGCGGILAKADSVANPIRRIPFWFMLGTSDDMFIVPPFTELPFYNDSILGYLKVYLNRMLACQGLTQTYDHSETPITQTYRWEESQTGGSSASPYFFTLVKNMRHQYPNGNNYPLEAAKLFWEFFKQSSTVGTEEPSGKILSVSAYPNPANDRIFFQMNDGDLSLPANLAVFNSCGQAVYQAKTDGNFILDKKMLGPGFFIVKIQNGSLQGNLKIVFN